ncbi:MAG: glutaredoxin domain-containing protein [Polyangiaceae bacterium]
MSKLDWIDVVDRALDRTDRMLDRFRKKPRKRLEVIPTPRMPSNPFETRAAAPPVEAPKVAPLGDPSLPAQVYGRRTCDRTARAIQILRTRSITARMIDLDDPENRDLEKRLIQETKRYETPFIYFEGKFVGSLEALGSAPG